MKILEDGICSIKSIKVSGYREGKYGVMVIYHENSTAAAVYTKNKVYTIAYIFKVVLKNLKKLKRVESSQCKPMQKPNSKAFKRYRKAS